MGKLKELDISNTDLDSGLECLPESVEKFSCSANERKEAKCQNICKLFTNEKGETPKKKLQTGLSTTKKTTKYSVKDSKNMAYVLNVKIPTPGSNDASLAMLLQFTDVEYLAEGGVNERQQLIKEDLSQRLESNSKLSFKRSERNEKIELLFKNFPSNREKFVEELESIKPGLSKKITTEEINDLYQPESELVQSKNLLKYNYKDYREDPERNYLMVMQYMLEGNMRNYLDKKNRELTLKDKISQLLHIAQGLKDIHQKNLVHRDFHSGNILKGTEKTSFYDRKTNCYTEKMPHDKELALEILKDADPAKRPTANELEKTLRKWQEEISFGNTEFTKQLQEVEKFNQTLPDELRFPKYEIKQVYTSRLLPTKEIAQLLKSSQEITDELKKVVREFIQAKEKSLKDEEDTKARNDARELEKKLEEELKKNNFETENMDEVIRYCEEVISSGQLEEEFQAKIEYPKAEKKIKLTGEDFKERQIVIEDYPELEKLYLRDIKSIDKVTLKNLPQLQEYLVIENCPQIKKLNVRKNLLTSLEFLVSLENLKNLEIDEIQELIGKVKLNPQKLAIDIRKLREQNKSLEDSSQLIASGGVFQQKYNELKSFLEKVLASLSQEAKQEFVDKLEKEKKEKGSLSAPGRTKELMLFVDELIKSAKEKKEELEIELAKSKTEVQELEKKFQEKEAKINYLESQVQELTDLGKQEKKKINVYLIHFGLDKKLAERLIKACFEFTEFKKQGIDASDYYEKCKEYKKSCERIEEDLQSKLPQETKGKIMNEVQRMLNGCERLVNLEMETEAKLSDKNKLIEEQKQTLGQVTRGKEKKEILVKAHEEAHQNQVQQFERERNNSVVAEIAKLQEKNEILQEQCDKMINQIVPESTTQFSAGNFTGGVRNSSDVTGTQIVDIFQLEKQPGLAELIKSFVKANKKFTRNKEDSGARKNAEKLYEELKNRNLSRIVEQIIEDCEKLVSLELLLEKKKGETQLLKEEDTEKGNTMPQSFESHLIEKEGIKGISRNIFFEIDISYKDIEENNLVIDGNEFSKLERVISRSGKIRLEKEIEISNCPELNYISVKNNLLIDLSFLKGLEKKLTYLDISDNDVRRSLEKLKKLSKLGKVDISNTNIGSGLECLPISVGEIESQEEDAEQANERPDFDELSEEIRQDEVQEQFIVQKMGSPDSDQSRSNMAFNFNVSVGNNSSSSTDISVGDNSTGTINKLPRKKYCLNCRTEVTSFPNNCQCMGSEYCSCCEGDDLMENCCCKKLAQKAKAGSSQTENKQKELPKEKTENEQVEVKFSYSQANNKEIVNKINELLAAKRDFLAVRQETIKELKECFNKLESRFSRHEMIGEIGNATSNIGGSITDIVTFGIPKAIGEAIKAGNNFSKIEISARGNKEFQISLADRESELSHLNSVYNSLINDGLEEVKLFNTEYKIFDILIKDSI
ncbi:5992_t:CDS:10 [Scutellospora calospora]|uniref:5992_t:CDS:1 n=1 Tax=Scutellospora calospora TaxID=85575 RepID=A0ACA9JV65_9GLOM|nr:5992_t:CDS:10 [Scutellospora calospora]